MLHSLKALGHFHIRAVDGEIGHIQEGYFDDERWVVRYLVARTGGWLSGREVLISPYSIDGIDERAHAVLTRLTRRQVQGSPSIDTAGPISRRYESSYLRYYGYPLYWPYTTFWAWGAVPQVTPVPAVAEERPDSGGLPEPNSGDAEEDVHLRSSKEVTDYHIQGSDEAVGHVEDFLFEEDTWAIRYLVADTRNWLPGKRVLVSPEWIREVTWSDRTVVVELTRAEIEGSPELHPDRLPSRDYEADLHRHYRRAGYWGERPHR